MVKNQRQHFIDNKKAFHNRASYKVLTRMYEAYQCLTTNEEIESKEYSIVYKRLFTEHNISATISRGNFYDLMLKYKNTIDNAVAIEYGKMKFEYMCPFWGYQYRKSEFKEWCINRGVNIKVFKNITSIKAFLAYNDCYIYAGNNCIRHKDK